MDNFTTQFKNILAKIATEIKSLKTSISSLTTEMGTKYTQAQTQAEIKATKLDYDPIEYFNTVYNG